MRISHEGYRGQKQDQAALTVPTPEPQEEDWDQELSFLAPLIMWEHEVNQTTAMGESEADVVGDEEVKVQDKGATARATPEAGVADMTWDPKDPFLESTDGNLSTPQISVAVSTPVLTPVEEAMPNLKDSSFEESRAEEP